MKKKVIPGQWGGWRPGSGRTPIKEGVPSITFNIRLTPDMRAKLEALGGAAWIREQIEAARLR
jgi:hypothetical protein